LTKRFFMEGSIAMPKTVNPDLGIVLSFIRRGEGWSQTRLCEAANVAPSLLNDYELGWWALKRPRLEHLLTFMAVPPDTIDETFEQLQKNRAAAKAHAVSGGLSSTRRRIEALAARASRLAGEFVRSVMSMLALEGEALQAREEARRLWARLERRAADERIEDSSLGLVPRRQCPPRDQRPPPMRGCPRHRKAALGGWRPRRSRALQRDMGVLDRGDHPQGAAPLSRGPAAD
jgi:transcriptional regulator with XRE-family HTH domain